MTHFLADQSAVQRLTERLQRTGETPIIVAGADSVDGCFAAFAKAADFPDYFGHNLDALFDCLRDLTGTLVWNNSTALRESDPAGYEQVTRVLRQADADNDDLHVYVAP